MSSITSAELTSEAQAPLLKIPRSKCRTLCCCLGCCGLFLALLATIGASSFYCCNLWIATPSVELEPLSFRPRGITADPKTLSLDFHADLNLRIENPNIFGGTVWSVTANIWYFEEGGLILPSRYVPLGGAELASTVYLKPQGSTSVPLHIGLVSKPESSTIIASLLKDCAQIPPKVQLLFNLTDITVGFWSISMYLSEVVFEVTIDDCLPSNSILNAAPTHSGPPAAGYQTVAI